MADTLEDFIAAKESIHNLKVEIMLTRNILQSIHPDNTERKQRWQKMLREEKAELKKMQERFDQHFGQHEAELEDLQEHFKQHSKQDSNGNIYFVKL